jgi:hypothetical protein
VTSLSVYARAPSNGTVKFNAMAAGVIDELMSCEPPEIVRFFEVHAYVAAGQTCTVHVEPAGEIEALLGMDWPENAPEPSSASGADGMVVLLSNGAPFQKY